MIIYDVVNIFSMKNNKSSRKLRVGVNWYPGVNWSTTTIDILMDTMARDVQSSHVLLNYPCSLPTQVHHLSQKILRTGNTETNGTKTNNDYVQLYWERLL